MIRNTLHKLALPFALGLYVVSFIDLVTAYAQRGTQDPPPAPDSQPDPTAPAVDWEAVLHCPDDCVCRTASGDPCQVDPSA